MKIFFDLDGCSYIDANAQIIVAYIDAAVTPRSRVPGARAVPAPGFCGNAA